MELVLIAIFLDMISISKKLYKRMQGKGIKNNILSISTFVFPYIRYRGDKLKKSVILMVLFTNLLASLFIVKRLNDFLSIGKLKMSWSHILSQAFIYIVALLLASYILKAIIDILLKSINDSKGFRSLFLIVFPMIYILFTYKDRYSLTSGTIGIIFAVQILSLLIIYINLIMMIFKPSYNASDFEIMRRASFLSLSYYFFVLALNFIAIIYHVDSYILPIVTENSSLFDISYYYLMTFLTFGKSHIEPINNLGKLFNILISLTSFSFIVAYISALMSRINNYK